MHDNLKTLLFLFLSASLWLTLGWTIVAFQTRRLQFSVRLLFGLTTFLALVLGLLVTLWRLP